jgi:hypothetical protein
LVEQCPFKAWVEGSNPSALTRISKHFADFGWVDFSTPGHAAQVKARFFTQLQLMTDWGTDEQCPKH